MLPGAYDLELYRGDSYEWDFVCWADPDKTQPADLTGVTAKAEIRNAPGGPTTMSLTCTVAANTVHVELPATLWADWTLRNGAWDLQLTYPDLAVRTIVAGTVTVAPDVTDSQTISTREAATVRRAS